MNKSTNLVGPVAVLGTMGALAAVAYVAKGDSRPKTTTRGAALPGSSANPLPVPSSDGPAKRIPAVAERLQRLWSEATGDASPMPPAALEIALSQAWLESGVADPVAGGWWKAPMTGSGNLGARQCNKGESGGKGFRCERWTDHHADGSAYETGFRYYEDADGRPAADWAALDFLKTIKQFNGYSAIKDGDVAAYAKALRAGHYFEAPEGDYARAIASHLPAVAAALGHDKIAAVIAPELLAKRAGDWAGTAKAGTKTAGVVDLGAIANDNAGAALQALHLAGALPRARYMPGDGSILWYIEKPATPVGSALDDAFSTITKGLEKIPVVGPAMASIAPEIKTAADKATEHDPRTSAEKAAGKVKEAVELAARKAAEACGPDKARAAELEAKIREWTTQHPHLAKWTKPDLISAIVHHEKTEAAKLPKADATPKHRPHTAGAPEVIDVTRTDPWRPLRVAREAAEESPEIGGTGAAFAAGALASAAAGAVAYVATRDTKPSPADPAIRAEPAPALPRPAPGTTAHVVLPRGQKGINATLRDAPWGTVVAGVEPGAVVTILGEKDAPEKRGKQTVTRRWYQITAPSAENGETVTGWMHSDLLPVNTAHQVGGFDLTRTDPWRPLREKREAEEYEEPSAIDVGGLGTEIAVGVLVAAAAGVAVLAVEKVLEAPKPTTAAGDVEKIRAAATQATGLPVPAVPVALPAAAAPAVHAAAQAAQVVAPIVKAASSATPRGPRAAPTGVDAAPTGMDAVDVLAKKTASPAAVDHSATPWLDDLPAKVAAEQARRDAAYGQHSDPEAVQAAIDRGHVAGAAGPWAPLRAAREAAEEAPPVGGVVLTIVAMLASAMVAMFGLSIVAARGAAAAFVARLEAAGIRIAQPGSSLPDGVRELSPGDALTAFAEPALGMLQREGWHFYKPATT